MSKDPRPCERPRWRYASSGLVLLKPRHAISLSMFPKEMKPVSGLSCEDGHMKVLGVFHFDKQQQSSPMLQKCTCAVG